MNQTTFDLSHFFRTMGKKWKMLVCFALIGAALLGVYGYRKASLAFNETLARHTAYAEAAKELPGYFNEELFNARENVGDPKRIAFAEAFSGLYRSFILQFGGEKMFDPQTENLEAYMMFLDSYKDVISVMSGPERAYFEMLASIDFENTTSEHPVVGDFTMQPPSVIQAKWIGVGLFLGLLGGSFVMTLTWKPANKEKTEER